MSEWINLSSQQPPPLVYGNVQNFPANEPAMLVAGWRLKDLTTVPALASGYERNSTTWVQDPGRPTHCIAVVNDTLIQDRLNREAAEAAAIAADRAAWQALKAAVQAIDPSLIDKDAFADANQRNVVQATKNAIKDIKDALRRVMDYARTDA